MEHPSGSGLPEPRVLRADGGMGDPDGFRRFVDLLHRRGVQVLVDWVPAHFLKDDFALARFDGTALFEHADPRQGEHPDWGTLVFNYGRTEVRNFLVANALYWLQEFHIDGLRVDAVASMLYLDYSRDPGEWVPNRHGGRENLEAIDFLRNLNTVVHAECPGVLSLAEESTASSRASPSPCTPAASASPTSGTWAGCTIRSPTSSGSLCIAATTTTSRPSASPTPGPSGSCCR